MMKSKIMITSVLSPKIIKGKKLFIRVNDQTFFAEHEDIPKQMHVGITACEGVNHFYELEIQSKE